MTIETIIRSWIDPEAREALGAEAPAHPAGLVALDDDALASLVGGADQETADDAAGGIFSTLFGSRKQTCCAKWKAVADGDAEQACSL
jgi:mersacidin/lichenicidin family type 2 lantibiotic